MDNFVEPNKRYSFVIFSILKIKEYRTKTTKVIGFLIERLLKVSHMEITLMNLMSVLFALQKQEKVSEYDQEILQAHTAD